MTRVSVVIPTYNGGPLLRRAVADALRQSHNDLEVIVVDDGSTDGSTDSLPGDSRLRILTQENAGKSAAMNRALEELTGDFYCVLDADDEMHAERVAAQAAALAQAPDVAAVFCGHELIVDGKTMAPQSRSKDREACARDIRQFRMPAHDPTAMYRVSAVGDLRYDPELRIGQGYDYILRVGERLPMLVIGRTLYRYRIDLRSITRKDPAKRREFVARARRKACDRRGLDYEATFPPRAPVKERNRDRDNFIASDFIESAIDQRRDGNLLGALRTGLQCAAFHPLDPYYYKPLLYGLLPPGMLGRLRRHTPRQRRLDAATA
ncbi:MAG: glycosyltransferase family A protein [Phycisphaerales bacterium]